MRELRWNPDKSSALKRTRGVSFEDLVSSRFLDIEKHHARENQRVMVFEYNNYAWAVPCVEEMDYYFLKTAYPSRKYTQKYLRRA